jgi:hypothetical protein
MIDAMKPLERRNRVASPSSEDIQFPVGEVQLEFHVGVTKDVDAKAASSSGSSRSQRPLVEKGR